MKNDHKISTIKAAWNMVVSGISENKGLSILLFIFILPFTGMIISDILGLSKPLLYKFGIDKTEDFYTFWIALFGISSVVINISQSQHRMSQQEEQMKNQQIQIELQKKIERDNRFLKGMELLGHDVEITRIGAIYTLISLARDFPDEYKKPVFETLCLHIKKQTNNIEYKKIYDKFPTNEIRTLLNLLFKKPDSDQVYLFKDFAADLGNAFLPGVHLKKAKLTKANLYKVNLHNAKLQGADLSECKFIHASLEKAKLEGTIFTNAKFQNTNISEVSDADFKDVIFIKATNNQ